MNNRQDLLQVIQEVKYQAEQMELKIYNGGAVQPIEHIKLIELHRKNIIKLLNKREIRYAIERIEEEYKQKHL